MDPERTTHHEYRLQYRDQGTVWVNHLRALGEDAARVALTELRDSTSYPWRIVCVTVTEEVLDA
jgi:hypothetical protein